MQLLHALILPSSYWMTNMLFSQQTSQTSLASHSYLIWYRKLLIFLAYIPQARHHPGTLSPASSSLKRPNIQPEITCSTGREPTPYPESMCGHSQHMTPLGMLNAHAQDITSKSNSLVSPDKSAPSKGGAPLSAAAHGPGWAPPQAGYTLAYSFSVSFP